MHQFTFVVLALVAATSGRFIEDNRIIGGQPATEGSFRYQVSLRTYGTHTCGGSLLNQNWVLTAAHCVYYVQGINEIGMGSVFLNKQKMVPVSKIIWNPTYNNNTKANDVALIKLAQPASGNIEFISLGNIPDKVPALLSGWGLTSSGSPNQLQWINLNVIDYNACKSYWGNYVSVNQVCTLNGIGQGFCYGDSGGPLVYNGKEVGIVSFINKEVGCAKGFPDVYARTASYANWITQTMSSN